MTTLVAIYQERKNNLKTQLENAKDTKQVVEILKDEITWLRDMEGEYIRELTPSQAQLASARLEELSLSLDMLTAVKVLKSPASKLNPSESKSKNSANIIQSTIIGSAVGVFTGGPLGLLIGGAIGAVTSIVATELISEERNKDEVVTSVASEENKLKIDVDLFLSYFNQALGSIDDAVESDGNKQKKLTSKNTLEEYSYVLQLLQDLIGESLDVQTEISPLMRKQIERISTILKSYDIEVRLYQPNTEESKNAFPFFELEPSLNPNLQEYVTLKPAFVKGDQVLLRGRVIEPVSSTQQ
jgi:hypothetical protein